MPLQLHDERVYCRALELELLLHACVVFLERTLLPCLAGSLLPLGKRCL